MSENGFNSIRFPLSAPALLNSNENGPRPNLNLLHNYMNPELVNSTTSLGLVQNITRALQVHKVSVLLDIHTLADTAKDPLWYRGAYTNIESTAVYQALSLLAETMCSDTYWNVLGVDLKNEPFMADWKATDIAPEKDWHAAATALGNMVVSKCPSWLVFVEGVGSLNYPADFHQISATDTRLYGDWHGANFRSALANPVTLNLPNKVVWSPHVYSHGVYPQNYFFTPDSQCSYNENSAETLCREFLNGNPLTTPLHSCSPSKVSCSTYKHLSPAVLKANVESTMDGMFGTAGVDVNAPPIVLGEFGGGYGANQPRQSLVTDAIIDRIRSSWSGGYFWALNPDSEYYLEDSLNGHSGIFPRTHYGLMHLNDWEKPHEDLLMALKRLPTTEFPCFGKEEPVEPTDVVDPTDAVHPTDVEDTTDVASQDPTPASPSAVKEEPTDASNPPDASNSLQVSFLVLLPIAVLLI